ncbi:MAG TPA: bifunctional 4-hydroxy-2-oxoglutarate aldolase/2-dehydro-3-deoxy-phosphogluconate aldolase [Streptosporangiaceae bacterium]|jgi:2-dehydro-3-deoxyphosphogluconate aldolase/(4S)-4-hydroxy-2-oxoglutarate aldolase|nr:bifunctional 4-hydroxy-2-oxoglutarate aldolase/2-dehydro-3-deoxy-phosphogluconate aldolase [Streptosporangiaceae bacterium]
MTASTESSGSTADGAARTTAAVIDAGLVAILRAGSARHFTAIADTLAAAGVRVIEVTLTTPGALTALRELSARLDGEAIVGAGTVMTADQAEACADAGARFLVSPVAAPDVIATARIAGLAVYPGAFTTTEIVAAHRAGASAVKLFPASAASPRYIADVHGPCPGIPIMPTGGIALGDIGTWLRAGAAAVGIGTPLVGAATDDGAGRDLTERARRAVAAVDEARAGR